MNERPLERLNYFNGQRLEASDLKTEQDYHMRVRRWLNKSLYDAGIGEGLGVRAAADGPFVIVSAGLALDDEGREIILLDETTVEVCSFSGSGDIGAVAGNYLVIEYMEEPLALEKSGGCAVRGNGSRTSASTTNVGGLSRVRAEPKFSWVPFPPPAGRNQIMLARVELTSDCKKVLQIDTGIRRYLNVSSATKVKQYAFEGEREVAVLPKESFAPAIANDVEVVGRIYFHMRGRQPNAVTLYLRAEEFSPLHYTELGRHTHPATSTTTIPDHTITHLQLNHDHGVNGLRTQTELQGQTYSDGATNFAPHEHYLYGVSGWGGGVGGHKGMGVVNTDAGPQTIGNNIGADDFSLQILGGQHQHVLEDGQKTQGASTIPNIVLGHSQGTTTSTITAAGVNSPARASAPLNFVDQLQVFIGPAEGAMQNRTADILNQLAANPRWAAATSLGNGASNHVLAVHGTGAIRLDFLPNLSFTDDEYCIELKAFKNGNPNGGRVLYNLYVE